MLFLNQEELELRAEDPNPPREMEALLEKLALLAEETAELGELTVPLSDTTSEAEALTPEVELNVFPTRARSEAGIFEAEDPR